MGPRPCPLETIPYPAKGIILLYNKIQSQIIPQMAETPGLLFIIWVDFPKLLSHVRVLKPPHLQHQEECYVPVEWLPSPGSRIQDSSSGRKSGHRLVPKEVSWVLCCSLQSAHRQTVGAWRCWHSEAAACIAGYFWYTLLFSGWS